MEIILPHEVKKHREYDYTWEMSDDEIEEKIKELRKEIYKLQKSRKKQPDLCIFRVSNHGQGSKEAHILSGFKVMNIEEGLFLADHWHPIQREEAKFMKEKYDLTEFALQVIDDTVKRHSEGDET